MGITYLLLIYSLIQSIVLLCEKESVQKPSLHDVTFPIRINFSNTSTVTCSSCKGGNQLLNLYFCNKETDDGRLDKGEDGN